MSERMIHGAPDSPGCFVQACLAIPSYLRARRVAVSSRARSSYAANAGNAWYVNFNDGNASNNDMSNANQVRCVRGGTWIPGLAPGVVEASS